MLSSNLQGLRNINTTGSSTSTVSSMNPFLKSFQTQLGSSIGKGLAYNAYGVY